MTVWEYRGTPSQVAIARQTFDACSFPWEKMRDGIVAACGGAFCLVVVEWADLSRYAAARGAQSATHDHDHGVHPVERRGRVLGLAYYPQPARQFPGKVVLDNSLEAEPALAAEVALSEGAHMVDFHALTNAHRIAIWNALHPGAEQDIPDGVQVVDGADLGHGHSWFDVGGYYEWLGEAWMGLFVRAFSPYPVTINFSHPPTDEAIAAVQALFLPPAVPPVVLPTVRGKSRGKVYHRADAHPLWFRLPGATVEWATPAAARAEGRRACRLCDPDA